MILFLVLILGFFALRLYNEQIVKTGGKTDNTTTFTSKVRVKAARGDILDRNGNLLVSNRASYDLVLNHYVLLTAKGTNNYLYQLVKRCEEVGIEYDDHFPISENRPFVYTLDQFDAAWQRYFQKFLEYKKGLDSDITAPLLMEKLRSKYKIPPEWTDEEARKVIGLRYEMDLRNCVYSLSNYVFLADASDEQLSAIVELNIPGMNVEASTVREYNTAYAAHILGYVGAMSPEQWEHYKDIPGYEMDSEVGQDGLEAAYEEYLHGIDGWRLDTVTADGTLVSSEYIVEPQAGANVEVSIDLNLQMAAEDSMADLIAKLREQPPHDNGNPRDGHDADGGAVVAMDIKTGQLLACASYPTYNPATFFEDYKELDKDPHKPIYNRALLATYQPGSTYKMSMVVAGEKAGYLNSGKKIYTKGVYDKYYDPVTKTGMRLYCLFYSNYHMIHGEIDACVALQKSCNYFFYDVADNIPIEIIDSTAKGFGLGEPTGVELPEYIGHRSNPESKAEEYTGEEATWYQGDKLLTAVGQAENRFTPIQLCVYASTLANRGTRYKATFLNRVVSSDYRTLLAQSEREIMSVMDISDDAYYMYSKGMTMVAEYGGTAGSTFKTYPVKVAAKTGTAQTGITGTSDNAAFVCYAPADDPQIAISVYVEKGGHGNTLAAIAKSLLDVYFEVGEVGDVVVSENQLS